MVQTRWDVYHPIVARWACQDHCLIWSSLSWSKMRSRRWCSTIGTKRSPSKPVFWEISWRSSWDREWNRSDSPSDRHSNAFFDFRFDTIRHQLVHLLDKVKTRTRIVEGLLKALLCFDDKDIGIIRTASDQSEAREAFMDEKNANLALSRDHPDAVLRL